MSGYTIKYFILAILTVGSLFANLQAQQLSDPAKEEAVKLSGDYYWEEASAKSITDAKDLARELLLKRILLDYNTNVEMSRIKATQVEGIDYLLYMRGPKYRIIAFIEKKNVTELVETLKEMSSVEVIHSDKYPDEINEESEQYEVNESSESGLKNKLDIENVSEDSLAYETPILASDSLSEQNENSDNGRDLASSDLNKKGLATNEEEIRSELSKILNAEELARIINHYKFQGKLVFGQKEVFNNPEKCDIVILNNNTKEIIAFLTHKDQQIINYNTNEIITDFSNKFYGMTAIWIQYFEN